MKLWAEGARHADMLSQFKLRQIQVRKLAALLEACQAQWEAWQKHYPALRFVLPWRHDVDPAFDYDRCIGLQGLGGGRE